MLRYKAKRQRTIEEIMDEAREADNQKNKHEHLRSAYEALLWERAIEQEDMENAEQRIKSTAHPLF